MQHITNENNNGCMGVCYSLVGLKLSYTEYSCDVGITILFIALFDIASLVFKFNTIGFCSVHDNYTGRLIKT